MNRENHFKKDEGYGQGRGRGGNRGRGNRGGGQRGGSWNGGRGRGDNGNVRDRENGVRNSEASQNLQSQQSQRTFFSNANQSSI